MPETKDYVSPQSPLRVAFQVALIATLFIAFVVAYAGVQYLVARRQMVEFSSHVRGGPFTDFRINSVGFDYWSVYVTWKCDVNGHIKISDFFTRTALLGFGWTHVCIF